MTRKETFEKNIKHLRIAEWLKITVYRIMNIIIYAFILIGYINIDTNIFGLIFTVSAVFTSLIFIFFTSIQDVKVNFLPSLLRNIKNSLGMAGFIFAFKYISDNPIYWNAVNVAMVTEIALLIFYCCARFISSCLRYRVNIYETVIHEASHYVVNDILYPESTLGVQIIDVKKAKVIINDEMRDRNILTNAKVFISGAYGVSYLLYNHRLDNRYALAILKDESNSSNITCYQYWDNMHTYGDVLKQVTDDVWRLLDNNKEFVYYLADQFLNKFEWKCNEIHELRKQFEACYK